MLHKYALSYKGKTVGTVDVEKMGRFYRISSRFLLPDKNVVRLAVACGDKTFDLGVCVRYNARLGTERWMPVGRIGEEPMQFYLQEEDIFVPVSDTNPFVYLDKVITGYFEIRSGVKGIVLRGDSV